MPNELWRSTSRLKIPRNDGCLVTPALSAHPSIPNIWRVGQSDAFRIFAFRKRLNSMASSHPQDIPPYLVRLEDGTEVPVDPNELEETGTTLTHVRGPHYLLMREGRSIPVIIQADDRRKITVSHGSHAESMVVSDHRDQLLAEWGADEGSAGKESRVESPMPGLVLDVKVEKGDVVEPGDPLLVLEAMKMENDIKAQFGGTVAAVHVGPGDAVGKSALLIEFE